MSTPPLAWEVWFVGHAGWISREHPDTKGVTVIGPRQIDEAIALAAKLTGGGPRVHFATLVRIDGREVHV